MSTETNHTAEQKIAAAKEYLDGRDYGTDGDYAYRDDATGETYVSDEHDLETLGEALLAGDQDGTAYSVWCAETTHPTLAEREAMDADGDQDAAPEPVKIVYHRFESRVGWRVVTELGHDVVWYLDPECTVPAPESVMDRAGEDIYTDAGWNVEPSTYPALAHVEVSPATEGGAA